jgi:hypothetical protein
MKFALLVTHLARNATPLAIALRALNTTISISQGLALPALIIA